MKFLAPLAVSAVLVTTTATAQGSPGDVTRVTEGLIAAGMALELGEQCDDVRIRYLRGLNFLQGLKSDLQDEGFSNAQIDAYIDNDTEKDRLEAIARARLGGLGVDPSNPASYCAVARSQIAQNTQVGRLLR